MVVSVLLPVQPKKIGIPGVFIFAVSTMICFFSSGDSIDDLPVEPMIRMAAEPLSSWNFKSVRKAAKSTEPSLLNGVISATNEPASIFDIFVSMREFEPSYHGGAGQPAAIAGAYQTGSTAMSTATTPSPVGRTMIGLRSRAPNFPAFETANRLSCTSSVANASMSPGSLPRAPVRI